MKKQYYSSIHNGFRLKPFTKKYLNKYIESFFKCDKIVDKLTGTTINPTKEQLISFYLDCITRKNRYDYLILDSTDAIIGECIINEIDDDNKSANFRIAIFFEKFFNQGIGSFALSFITRIAFEKIHLNNLTLSVYCFNDRAYHIYKKNGFEVIDKDFDEEVRENEYVMELNKDTYFKRKSLLRTTY